MYFHFDVHTKEIVHKKANLFHVHRQQTHWHTHTALGDVHETIEEKRTEKKSHKTRKENNTDEKSKYVYFVNIEIYPKL